MKSSMIEIKIGEKVVEVGKGKKGILKDIKLVPNGCDRSFKSTKIYKQLSSTDFCLFSGL